MNLLFMPKILPKLINISTVLALSLSLLLLNNAQAMSIPETKLQQTLAEHRGQVVYLDFWASWCGPCRKSFPWMNKMQQKYRDQGFVIISVNLDADKTLATEFLLETPANFLVIYDPEGDIAQKFNIQGMPSSLLIDKQGNVQQAHTGFFTHKVKLYETQLMALLAVKEGVD
jgi:thiol-disulfide isomerase/thioredoxin